MIRSLALFIVLSLLPLAGCLSPDDNPVETASTDASDPATANAAQTSVPAGAPGEDAASLDEVRVTPVDWDGATGDSFCVPSGPYSCFGTSMGRDDLHKLEVSGTASGELTLTWDAATPQSDTLDIFVWVAKSCGDSCLESSGDEMAYTSGASPLLLPFELEVAEGEMLVISVDVPRLIPAGTPIYGRASLDQPFHVEGLVSSTA